MCKIRIKFTKQPTGVFNLAYNDGDETELDAAKATEIMEAGYAVQVKPNPSDDIGITLPEDIPYRNQLIELGLKTIDDIKAYDDDLSVLKGIGKKSNKTIQDFLTRNP